MTEPKLPGKKPNVDYVIELHDSLAAVPQAIWNDLLATQASPTPFMRHEYLSALHDSQSAGPDSGWLPLVFVLRDGQGDVQGACVCYLKNHSYGEYVFDWAWADAYARHGLDYYPKAVLAVPFTPVPGTRLLARNAPARLALLKALVDWSREQSLSSLHMLFAHDDDIQAARGAGLMLRQTVQFHWHNDTARPFVDFDDFLARLNHDKRKKIRQERRKVAEAGITFRPLTGREIDSADWDFFYKCYERTYLAHGNAPYLNRDFFAHLARDLPDHWLMFMAERNGRPVACSLLGLHGEVIDDRLQPTVAYGRYWGTLEDIGCLHFEACYYQPIAWCIAHGVQRFEGGAQGEHKMARALMPVHTSSAHWLAHPAFADAVRQFLGREATGVDQYVQHLLERSPFRHNTSTDALPASRPVIALSDTGIDDAA